MTSLTIAVDEETLKRARVRAIQEGTSVNAVLRQRLDEYAGSNEARRRALREILESSARSTMRLGARSWKREEIHDRRRAG
jgi:hypothetical protein